MAKQGAELQVRDDGRPGAWRLPIDGRGALRRLALSVGALWLLLTLVFVGLHLSGNPVLRLVGEDATHEDVRNLERQLGYDAPLPVQYARFLAALTTGRFPDSLQYNRPALEVVAERLPQTVLLAVAGISLGLGLGLAAGWLGAFRADRPDGRIAMALLSLAQATPPFLMGIGLVLLFAVHWKLLPTGGQGSLRHLVLPALTVALFTAPVIGRVFRASLSGTAALPHVTTARAKSLTEARIRRRHILVNALIPVVTVTGLQLGSLLGGMMIVEQVFGWPGLGQLSLNAVSAQDYPLVLASTFVMAVAFVVTSFGADLLSELLDPRGAAK